MRTLRWNRRSVASIGALLLAATAAAFVFGAFARHDHAGQRTPPAGTIAVVDAPDAAGDRRLPETSTPPTPASHDVPSTDAVAARIERAYPLLSDVVLSCQGDRCTLTATLEPPNAQADLDKRQEMLLGGLAAELAASGYRLDIPFQMDEIDDNKFHIRGTATRTAQPA